MTCALRATLAGRGWLTCDLELDGQHIQLTASYLSDAPGDLLTAAVHLVRGSPETALSFAEEPGEYRWRLRRLDAELVQVTILWFDQLWGDRPEVEGRVVVAGACRLRRLAGAVLSALTELGEAHGHERYHERWGHRFPHERLAELRTLLRAQARARRQRRDAGLE